MRLFKHIPYFYLLAVPVLALCLGHISNQAVMLANHEAFPVMVNAKDEKLIHDRQVQERLAEIFVAISAGSQGPFVDPRIPQALDNYIDRQHVVMDGSSHLKLLADWIDWGEGVYSPGDVLILTGLYTLPSGLFGWIVLLLRRLYELEYLQTIGYRRAPNTF